MHRQGAFAGTYSTLAQCPVTEALCASVLSLPLDPYKTRADVDRVAEALKQVL